MLSNKLFNFICEVHLPNYVFIGLLYLLLLLFFFVEIYRIQANFSEAARKRLRDKLGDKNYQITPRKLLVGSYIQDRGLRISFLLILIKLFLFSFFLVQIFENIQNIKEFLAC